MDILEKLYINIKRQVTNLPASLTSTVDLVNKSMNQVRIPPLTKDNILYYYMPIQGLVSYTTLSVSVMNPQLITRLFPRRDITDVLFLSAGGGAGLWLWSRPHIATAAPARRFSWAFLGGCLWPLGSIFMWAILRSSIGHKPFIGTVLGLTTGGMLTNIALDYFQYVELMFCGELHVPDDPYSPNSDDEKYDIDM
ncbi:uncharacterized protein LOC121731131 [Aricia agestis]|uniref:uncharacterized protein LOC121731131 n=1 Tax=Aricia agestis TaxID=91739 RepID=UPI001C20635F|nr:uncharacterized protein LOC121731131 [Aricia agestis]